MGSQSMIGIMGAVLEEIDSIRQHMVDVKAIDHGSRTYYTGKIYDHPVVLVFSRWGKVAAATTVTGLITEFNIKQLIFTGVAGACAKDLNIGDVVISDRVYQHDMDARPLFKKHEIPLVGITYFQADKALKEKAYQATEGLFLSLTQKIPQETLDIFQITCPQSRFGIIATGDQFVYRTEQTQAVLSDVPDVAAIEMEGAAVAQVCCDYGIPFVVIRTISDKADHASELDFPKFSLDIARHYSEHIVLGMLA